MKLSEVMNLLWGSLGIVEKGIILLTIVLYVVFSVYGPTRGQVSVGMTQGARSLVRVSLLILAGAFLGGLIGAILPRAVVAQVLGSESGLKGIFIGTIIGALMPGGPYAYLPIVAALYSAGAGLAPIISLIFAKDVTNLPFIPYLFAYLAPVNAQNVIYIKLLFGIPIPIIMGLISRFFF